VIGEMRVTRRLEVREITSTGPYRAKPIVAQMSGLGFILGELFILQATDVRALPVGKGISFYVPVTRSG
jgi:hypothetical protein